MLTLGEPIQFSNAQWKQVKDAEIKIIELSLLKVDKAKNKIKAFHFSDKNSLAFDTVYSALGCRKNNRLGTDIGARIKKGELFVNKYQQTNIKGLYAAGDIVSGLNQICVAQPQGAIAATAINKYCQKM